jgi:5-methylcytosine-specific restriction endonuclease McrBC GTP-binding regulatory subunit McrB
VRGKESVGACPGRAAHSYRKQDGMDWFIIFDEMNLAHVEYYFADLLSILESGLDEEGWTLEKLQLFYPDEAEGEVPAHGRSAAGLYQSN